MNPARSSRAVVGSLAGLAVTGGVLLLLQGATWMQAGRQRLQARTLTPFSQEQPVRTEAVRLLERIGALQQEPVPLLNEIASRNQAVQPNTNGAAHEWLSDPEEAAPDWIELYNPHSHPVSLNGLTLTDDPAAPGRWAFPDVTLQPGGYMVVWASGRDDPQELHTNFRISARGEYVGLYDSKGFKCDSVQVPGLAINTSWARREGDPASWGASSQPTPGAANVMPRVHTGEVRFSHPPGFYESAIQLTLRGPRDMTILYSLDGAAPVPDQAAVYGQPLRIDRSTVVTARAVQPDGAAGPLSSQSFLFEQRPSVPVLSLIIDPQHLEGGESGIFSNWENKTLEHPVEFEFIEPATGEFFQARCGMSIAGGTTRQAPKKSFKLVAREIHGAPAFYHPFFEDLPFSQYEGLFVRADTRSGMFYDSFEEAREADIKLQAGQRLQMKEPRAGERIKNELIYEINKLTGGQVDMQAYQPVEVYINGRYWGLYNLMETKGRRFIEHRYGVRNIDLLTSEPVRVLNGSRRNYDELLDFLNRQDLSRPESFEDLSRRIDVMNLIDWWVLQIYIGAGDYWVNTRYWRPHAAQGRWKWIGQDYDDWSDWEDGMLEDLMSYDEAEGVHILHKLCENPTFQARFIQRMCEFLDGVLRPESVIALIDRIDARVRVEKARDRARWSGEINYERPGAQVAHLKEYARLRPAVLVQELIDVFGAEHLPVSAQSPSRPPQADDGAD